MSWIAEKLYSIYSGKNPKIRETLAEVRATRKGELLYGVQYAPKEDDILYHYCDAQAFLSITQSRNLWFSDVFAMNDFAEMHWGYSIWEQAAGELVDELSKEFVDRVDEQIHETSKHLLPLICCFSKDGDVLSQWRAYSQDGRGYAIGFSASGLGELPARALQILYDKGEQIEFVKRWLRAIFEVEEAEHTKFGEDFLRAVSFFAMDLCALKNPGFREEMEVRYVNSLNIFQADGVRYFKDLGGVSFGKAVPGADISFRMRNSIPVAFIKQDFSDQGSFNPIRQVVLGPKNEGMRSGVSLYLETIDLHGINVTSSETSYS